MAIRTPGNCGTKRFRNRRNANTVPQMPSVIKSHDQTCVNTHDTKERIPLLFKTWSHVRSGS